MRITTLAASSLAFALAAPPAGAATVHEISMAVDRCQPALPAFDTAFRKRPLAMKNESTSPAFVTCAYTGGYGARRLVSWISVGLINEGPTAVTFTCTLVDYQGGAGQPRYFPKTITVFAGSSAELGWQPSDNAGERFIYPAASCSIPGGVGIRWTATSADQDTFG